MNELTTMAYGIFVAFACDATVPAHCPTLTTFPL